MSGWETTEGGGLPGADGPVEVAITSGSFNYDAAYNNGESLVFILEGDCDHPVWQETVLYSIGAGWETDDNVTVTGRDAFNGNSNYARFFKAALETDAADIIMERGTPDDASIWEGLIFGMERKPYKGFDGEDKFLLVPTSFIGEAGSKKKAKAKAKPKRSNNGEVSRKDLKKLAKKYDDHDDFVEAVLDKYPSVEDNEDLYDEVLDEDGIWADAQ